MRLELSPRPALLAAIATLPAAVPAAALAQSAAEPVATSASAVVLDYANVVATGSTIILNRLPIKLPNGSYIYKDVTINLTASTTGVLTVSPAKPAQTASPPVLSAKFNAGTYVYPSNPNYGLVLVGPSVVAAQSITRWQTNAAPTLLKYCGIPTTFYVGDIKQNPLYATRLKPAGITSTEYSYGIIEDGSTCGGQWGAGTIIGASQSGDYLTVASFKTTTGQDAATPQSRYTYRLK